LEIVGPSRICGPASQIAGPQYKLQSLHREPAVILEISNSQESILVEITSESGKRKVRVGESEIACDWIRLGDDQYSLILDGSVFDLFVRLDTDSFTVTSRAGTYSLQIADPRDSALKLPAGEGQPGLRRICAEMPGKVVRVLVKGGDTVVADQSVLILEAMKMQNEIRAPKSGTVVEIRVSAGITVNAGDFLFSIE
jgi:biotin carboxyl carrier protein